MTNSPVEERFAVARSGDKQAFSDLVELYRAELLVHCYRMLGSAQDAEDMVQEAFMRLHAQFDEVREPRRWLYRTVHNLSLNHRRRADKIVPLQSAGEEHSTAVLDPPDPQPLPDEQIARWEGIGLVRLSLETLDPRGRELIRLKFNEGLSYKEMSARTGLNIGHVGYLLHHAIKAIADELAKNGVVP